MKKYDYNIRCKKCGKGFNPTTKKQVRYKYCAQCMKKVEKQYKKARREKEKEKKDKDVKKSIKKIMKKRE